MRHFLTTTALIAASLASSAAFAATAAAPALTGPISVLRCTPTQPSVKAGFQTVINCTAMHGEKTLKQVVTHFMLKDAKGNVVYDNVVRPEDMVPTYDKTTGKLAATYSVESVPIARNVPAGTYSIAVRFESDQGATSVENQGTITILPAEAELKKTLTFEDNFDGPKLNKNIWTDSPTHGPTINRELEGYIPDSYFLKDGIINMVTRAQKIDDAHSYTSGHVTTRGTFTQTYGYFEMRAKFTKGPGLWPAFWLLAEDNTWPPEFDVFEYLGYDPHNINQTTHYMTAKGKNGALYYKTRGDDLSLDFHTYAVDWRPDRVRYLMDGIVRYEHVGAFAADGSRAIPNKPMYLMFNTAVSSGGWAKQPDATTPKDSSFQVDYVRAYKYDDASINAAVLDPIKVDFGKGVIPEDKLYVKPGDTVPFSTRVIAGVNLTDAKVTSGVVSMFGEYTYRDQNGKIYKSRIGYIPTIEAELNAALGIKDKAKYVIKLTDYIAPAVTKLGNLQAGQTVPVSGSFTIPADAPAGVYAVSSSIVTKEKNHGVNNMVQFTVLNKDGSKPFEAVPAAWLNGGTTTPTPTTPVPTPTGPTPTTPPVVTPPTTPTVPPVVTPNTPNTPNNPGENPKPTTEKKVNLNLTGKNVKFGTTTFPETTIKAGATFTNTTTLTPTTGLAAGGSFALRVVDNKGNIVASSKPIKLPAYAAGKEATITTSTTLPANLPAGKYTTSIALWVSSQAYLNTANNLPNGVTPITGVK